MLAVRENKVLQERRNVMEEQAQQSKRPNCHPPVAVSGRAACNSARNYLLSQSGSIPFKWADAGGPDKEWDEVVRGGTGPL